MLDTLFSGQDIGSGKVTENISNITIPDDRTENRNESLSRSILRYIEAKKASRKDLEEAFCRDIDAFSEVFEVNSNSGKPISCNNVPPTLCAVMYDSRTCSSGGWKLEVANGTQKRLLYFSSDWKYRLEIVPPFPFLIFKIVEFRNDADTIGVRHGCTFTGFTGSSFDGEQMVVTAGITDRLGG